MYVNITQRSVALAEADTTGKYGTRTQVIRSSNKSQPSWQSTTLTAFKADQELTVLLTKLHMHGIQEDVGDKPNTSEEEKKRNAENPQSTGKGRRGKKPVPGSSSSSRQS